MGRFQKLLCAVVAGLLLFSVGLQPKLKSTQENAPEQQNVEDGLSAQPTEQQPAQPQQSATIPTEPVGINHIGSYDRSILEGLDRSNNAYGPGPDKDEQGRPVYPMQLNEKYAEYDAWFIGPDNGCVYLTFDLGWENDELTNDILDILRDRNVKAVFFVLMEYVEANPDIIRRIIEEGHILASHAYRHKVLAELSLDEIAEQILMLHQVILEDFGYEMKLFRPPSGEFSEQVLAVAHALGYRTVNWSYAYVDWEADNQPDVQKSYQRLMNAAHSGCIYLLHTVSTTNAALLGDLIDALRAEGYQIALFTEDT